MHIVSVHFLRCTVRKFSRPGTRHERCSVDSPYPDSPVLLVCTGLEGSTRVFSVISSCIVDASLGR